jgi:hypothetical protein
MASITAWTQRVANTLRTLTQHRAAGPLLGALAILLVARYGPVPTPLSAPLSFARSAATAAGPPQGDVPAERVYRNGVSNVGWAPPTVLGLFAANSGGRCPPYLGKRAKWCR